MTLTAKSIDERRMLYGPVGGRVGEDLTSNQEALIWKVAGLLFRAPGCLTAKEFREQYLPQFLSDAELQEIQGIYSAQHDAPGATAALERNTDEHSRR
jgi:hypothetical protein